MGVRGAGGGRVSAVWGSQMGEGSGRGGVWGWLQGQAGVCVCVAWAAQDLKLKRLLIWPLAQRGASLGLRL